MHTTSVDKKKTLGLTMRVHQNQTYYELRDCISHDWVLFLEALGYNFVFIPNKLKNVRQFLDNYDLSGFILTGGDSICPESYGRSAPLDETMFIQRDITEKCIIKYAIETNKPLLGVCRGMQIINVFFGGDILEDIQLDRGKYTEHVASRHEVEVIDSYMFNKLGYERYIVNSYHKQGIDKNNLGSNLSAWALSKQDGIVEGLYHRNYPIWGIMWHPEREVPIKEEDSTLFKFVFNKRSDDHKGNNTFRR